MDISQYRGQFASFNSSLELARYQYHIGLTPEFSTDQIHQRYSDLFSAEAIAELKTHLDLTSTDFETERTGLERLLSAARLEYVELQTSELRNELARCEASAPVNWKGETTSIEGVAVLLTKESDKAQRNKLGARWIKSISICDELRMASVASLNESARSLGFVSYRPLILESNNSNPGHDSAARSLLEQTDAPFRTAFARVLAREFPHLHPDELSFADLPYFKTLPWLDGHFPSQNLVARHAKIMNGLGIRLDQQRSIQVDAEPRPARKIAAACFPVDPPADVRLAILPLSGASIFLDGLEEFGKALHHIWCSPGLTKRHPEFVYSSAAGTSAAFGYLFRYLPIDCRWALESLRQINEIQAGQMAKDIALDLALRVRQLCADALYQAHVYDGDQSWEQLQSTYVELHKRATPFRTRAELSLFALQNRTRPAMQLRALAFSFGLREYLRVRYGHRWWASRKAGDELIDLWSTSSRYSVEEMASLVGLGELNFDLLAEAANTALRGA